MTNNNKSAALFDKAKTLMPGGVNSPVRAFKSVNGTPRFMKKGEGALLWDEDGNQYIDFCCSWGPLILGHANKEVETAIIETVKNGASFGTPTVKENELAELIVNNHKYIDLVRFTTSGTEAVMSALRLARGYTQKNKVLKFDGCYHGHVDSLLVNAGSGLVTFGTSSSAGVPEAFAKETMVLPLNDIKLLKEAFEQHHQELACVIIEPIPANNGLLLQDKSFLQELRALCTEYNVLLIFDEVISGFRVGFEGAAGLFGIQPDLITMGKIIGGGMPVGAYGGKKEIMENISPLGAVYQAGTLAGNPVTMAGGAATLKVCLQDGFYETQAAKTEKFVGQIMDHVKAKDYTFHIQNIGSIFWFAFSKDDIKKASQIDPATMELFKKFFDHLLNNGVYIGPSGYEVGFVSWAHDEATLSKAAKIICDGLDATFA